MREEEEEEKKKNNNDQSEEVVRWERILPRMVLRVLLVEADHSTRQIIAALLRKCSYTVIAVPDGLKAWETLKRKAPDVDLILTEVELPAISGFALLTLIMEHDFCKNIPVIMMSSHDSVSMVLKCMFKGAADFLIKPVRRNELKNLWQHVWRRHAISMSLQNPAFQQKKLETASEDNSAGNQYSGSVASSQKNNECSEKLSEAQSTCTSPFLEAESAYMENMQDGSQLKSFLKLSNIGAVKHKESTKFERGSAKHDNETEKSVSEAARCNEALKSTDLRLEQDHGCAGTKNEDEVLRAKLSRANPNVKTKIHGSNDELVDPSIGAIDLISTFENLSKHANENCSLSGGNSNKFDFDTQLELSLRRDFPGSSSKQAIEATEERQTLNHSTTSAFCWYSGSKLLQPIFPTPLITSTKVNTNDWHSHESHKLSGNLLDACDGINQNPENMNTAAVGQGGEVRPKLINSQCGVTSDLKSRQHGSVFTPLFYAQSDVHPILNPKPVCQKESSPFPTSISSQSNPESNNSEPHCHWSDDAAYTSLDQNVRDKIKLDHAKHGSPAAGQSASNSLCHDAANCIDSAYGSIGSASDGNATSAVVTKNYPESLSDDGYHNYDGFRGTSSHRSSQREAALTKFRLKRKERCYEKKVRYQSRKKLAEQRPRVKGQFVRQVQNDHPVGDAGMDC